MKRWLLVFVFVVLVTTVACSPDSDVDESEMGEIVPEITISSQTPEAQQVHYETAQMLASEWEELGLDVTVQPMETNTLLDSMYSSENHDFDVATSGWTGRVERLDPDMFIYSVFHSSNAGAGGNNATGFQSEAFDQVAEAQRVEMDQDARRELVWDAQEILADEVPIITNYIPSIVQAYNKERFDNFVLMTGEGLFNEWTPQQVEPLTDDKVLRLAALVDLDTLNPTAANTAYEWRLLRLVYDKLIRISPDGEATPSAASDWDIVDDTTIDVTIRSGQSFHDGEALDVEDVLFTFEYFMEWETPYFISFLDPIDSVEIVDDETIRFNLVEPYAPFINNTLAQIPILPKHIWETIVEDEDLTTPMDYANLDPVGSGPFEFEHWRRGEEVMLNTFEDYHQDVAIDGLIYSLYGNPEGVITALETGDVDMTTVTLIPSHIQQAQNLEHLEVTEVPDIGFQFIALNLRRAPFDDKAFRQAIAHTVDYDLVIEAHLQGYGYPGGAGLVIGEANEFWHNTDVERPVYEPERAREMLSEAGYTWDSEGRLRFPAN